MNQVQHPNGRKSLRRFGVFEIDLVSGELRKNGARIRLQEKPFQLLVILLERPGEVVTREELKQRIWPDSAVELHLALPAAASKIRQALGDSASSPRFVETIPKRGYRFIGTAGPQAAAATIEGRRFRYGPAIAVACVVSIALGALAFLVWSEPPESKRLTFSERALTYRPGEEQWPAFSHDGTRVAFDWNGGAGDSNDIYFVYVAGGSGEPTRVTSDPRHEKTPAWSPDGGTIVFARFLEFRRAPQESPFEMVLMSLDGREQVLNQFRIRGQQTGFDWSPDGRFIAFQCRLDGPVGLRQVCIYSLDTDKYWSIAVPTGALGHVRPKFSPDGRSVVYLDTATFTMVEQRLSEDMRPEGEPRVLVEGFGRGPVPAGWSDDGKRVYFVGVSLNGESGLWEVDVAADASPELVRSGRDPSQCELWQGPSDQIRLACAEAVRDSAIMRVGLTQTSLSPTPLIDATGVDANPQFSPKGNRIAFLSDRTGTDSVWICNADGSDAMLLTEFRHFSFSTPSWSPDGRRIALDAANELPRREVYVIDVAAGKVGASLTQGTGRWPSWTRNQKSVYFTQNDSKAIWKLNIDTRDRVIFLDGYGTGPMAESGDHKSLYFVHADGLMSVPLDKHGNAAGEPVIIAHQIRSFAVLQRAVYFMDRDGVVSRYDERTGIISLVIKTDAQPQPYSETNGISVSPDERWLLYTKNHPPRWDLKLLESVQ